MIENVSVPTAKEQNEEKGPCRNSTDLSKTKIQIEQAMLNFSSTLHPTSVIVVSGGKRQELKKVDVPRPRYGLSPKSKEYGTE